MFAVKVPPKLIFSVNRAVILALITLTPVTLGALVATHLRSVVWTEAGSTASLKFTSYVYVPGAGGVKVPPTGGIVVSHLKQQCIVTERASKIQVPLVVGSVGKGASSNMHCLARPCCHGRAIEVERYRRVTVR